MGRGKKRMADARLSPLAEGASRPALVRARPVAAAATPSTFTLSSAPRTPRLLPEHLKPRYASAEPDQDVLRYARTHARNVAKGELKGALLLLRDNMRHLRRGYPALDTLLESVVKRAIVEADASERCERLRAQAYALSQSQAVVVRDDPELADAVRQALVASLRDEGDPFAAAKATALAERRERLAGQAARSIIGNGPEWLVANWLQPLYLDRFLWRAYGRDYSSMPWPFAEQLQPLIARGLSEEEGDLRERLLPELVAAFWPEVRDLVAGELQERTFSAKWDLDRARLALIGGGR